MTVNLLTTAQVAARLGVRPQTIYAYVSRGTLHRTLTDNGRESRFDPTEVEQLAKRGRPRLGTRRVGSVEVTLASSITAIGGGYIAYRGYGLAELCRTATFEQVAQLLWLGELPDTPLSFPETESVVALSVARCLPKRTPAIERFFCATAAFACEQPLRSNLRLQAVAASAGSLLAVLVASLPLVGKAPQGKRLSLARRLWPCLSALPAQKEPIALLDSYLVCLADHELATSTLAARVAASTGADPYAAVLAGFAASSGKRHGSAAVEVHQLLLDAERSGTAETAVAQWMARDGGRLAGFGHPVYTQGDPRAELLLPRLAILRSPKKQALVRHVLEIAVQQTSQQPNIDWALGALAFILKMDLGATSAIFTLPRVAGWVAHILEEYGESPLRYRAQAIYEGPPLRCDP